MSSHDRRAAGRRRAWGRRPIILKLESLERREMLTASATAASSTLPDLVNSALITSTSVSDWNGNLEVEGRVKNQGGSTTTAPFQITIYASGIRGINRNSVPIGSVVIPSGLAPGQSVPYQTSVNLPSTPIPSVSSSGGTVYVDAVVNPAHTIQESNYHNNEDLGPPYDAVPELIQAPIPAQLQGTTLAVTPGTATWGSTISVTAQITNQSSGSSPQTRALLAITPQGLNYGSTTTVGIGSIIVPPLGPFQTVNLVQSITLPAVEPTGIANYTSFGLTMTQDADYVTNVLYPNQPDQGIGLDQTAITITTDPTSTATQGPLPDLAISSVLPAKTTVQWGSAVQVTTEVQNLGVGASSPSTVRFVLTGQGGALTDAIFLADVPIPALAPMASQQIQTTLELPIRLPANVELGNVGYARIAAISNPENTQDESVYSNGVSLSGPFIVRLPGNATTVPTTQAAGTLPSIAQLAQKSQNAAKSATAKAQAAKLEAKVAARNATKPAKKLHRKEGKGGFNVTKSAVSVGTEITKLPTQVYNALKRSL
jgi:CARDB